MARSLSKKLEKITTSLTFPYFFLFLRQLYIIMKRKITTALKEWKQRKGRKPLLVNGARQIGKTYSINEFGRTDFSDSVYINLETNPLVKDVFEGNIEPQSLIPLLESLTGKRIIAGETLLFLDEIQASERALLSLKYFCELAPQYHVVAAGSLLGVAVNRYKYSFPVGKIDELNMYPFDFEEFLWAFGKDRLAEDIQSSYLGGLKPLPLLLHQMALEMYNHFCIIGGMPAVIADFLEHNSFLTIKNPQTQILNEYLADMSKYTTFATALKVRSCYNSIPTQLAKENKKFQYKVVQKGGT